MRLTLGWSLLPIMLVALQALVCPEANLLSVRDDSPRILRRMSAGRESPWLPDTGVVSIMAPDYRCGFPVRLEELGPRLSEITSPLRSAARDIYQSDLLDAAVEALPPWRVRLWQLRYGVGLWSGRLDDGPVPPQEVEKARRFAMTFYQMRVRQRPFTRCVCVSSHAISRAGCNDRS